MDEQLPPQSIRDFSAGQIDSINDSVRPRNSVALAVNVDFDTELGSATTRLGTFIVGGQMVVGKPALGLHDYRQTAGSTQKLLVAINDTDDTGVIYDAKSGHVEVTNLTGFEKTRFLTFLDSVLAINGTDLARAFDGTNWITTGGAFDLANIPANVNLAEEFLDRVYLAGDPNNPDRMYQSASPSNGSINWTDSDFIDIEPENGAGGITGFGKVPGYLLIFKERSLHRFNFVSAFPESLINVGTPSQESIISKSGVCAFFSASSRNVGFYVTDGSRPVAISHFRTKNIQKIVSAINPTFYHEINGWGDDAHFFWSIGDITLSGTTYKNVVVRWSIMTGEWAMRTYPQRPMVGANYVDPEGFTVNVFGSNNGEVIEIDKQGVFTDYVTADNGEVAFEEIVFDIRTYREKFGLNQKKIIKDRLNFDTDNGKGQTPYVVVDGSEIVELESITADVSECRLPKDITGNYFQFGLRGAVKGAPVVLKEIEIPSISVSKNVQ